MQKILLSWDPYLQKNQELASAIQHFLQTGQKKHYWRVLGSILLEFKINFLFLGVQEKDYPETFEEPLRENTLSTCPIWFGFGKSYQGF